MLVWMICIMKVSSLSKLLNLLSQHEKVELIIFKIIGEGHFDDGSSKPSGAATPIDAVEVGQGAASGKRGGPVKPKGISKKAKTAKQKLAIADGL